MGIGEAFQRLEESSERKDVRHTLFDLAMQRVDLGEITVADVKEEVKRLEAYYSDEGAHKLGHVVLPPPIDIPDDISALTQHAVTTALDVRQ